MSQAPMSRAESYESSIASPSDASGACMRDEIYDPANRDQLKPSRTESGASKCESDDDFNSYMSDSLNTSNIYDSPSQRPLKPWEKSLDKGQDRLSKSSDSLQDAISSLDAGDSSKAAHQIENALKNSGRSLNKFEDARKEQMGGGVRGAYGEDALKDGSREISGARTEMQSALDLLKGGNTGEAYESIREALKGLKSGGKEVQAGEDVLKGKTNINSTSGRETATDREFNSGLKNFDRSNDSLSSALNSLDHNDSGSALRDLVRSQNTLTNGLNNVKDGLKLNSDKQGDESGIKAGLDDASGANDHVGRAIELVKSGNTAEAKRVISEAMDCLDKGGEKIGEGVNDLADSRTPIHAYDANARLDSTRYPEEQVERTSSRTTYDGGTIREGRDTDLNRDSIDNSRNLPWDRIRTMPVDVIGHLNNGEFVMTGVFNRNGQTGGNDNLNSRGSNVWNPFESLPQPPNPFDLFGGGSSDRGSNGGGGPLDLFGNLPQPPNPFDLFGGGNDSRGGGSGGPLDLLRGLPQPPNPFDLFGGGNDRKGGGTGSPLDLISSLPKPPNPLELVSNLPKPADVLENITRPDKLIKKIFGGLFG
ncbi:MAG: hypothetical protein IAF58_20670 [Leptolyngbya sp.]|nr:hypothetical protein [Candidatus Melainabacteria bacterium]